MKYTKIKKIEKTETKPIYHLTVNNNHNFFGNNLCLHNCGYRGEIIATFKKIFQKDYSKQYEIGDRGAQIIVIPYPKTRFVEVEELSKTDRGTGGFGSTNKS